MPRELQFAPELHCDPSVVAVGGRLRARLSNVSSRVDVSISVTSDDRDTILVLAGPFQVDDTGAIEVDVAIPSETAPGPYNVDVVGIDFELGETIIVLPRQALDDLPKIFDAFQLEEKASDATSRKELLSALRFEQMAANTYELLGQPELARPVWERIESLSAEIRKTPSPYPIFSDKSRHKPQHLFTDTDDTPKAHQQTGIGSFAAALKNGRWVLDKMRDLERGRKVDEIFGKRLGEEPAVIACMRAFRQYIEETVIEAEDIQLDHLKFKLLFHVDQLVGELELRASMRPGARRIQGRFNTNVLLAYRNLHDHIRNKGAALRRSDAAVKLTTISSMIWGGK